nr:PREDICTED: G-protein coupled receptor 56-like [Lepisosteus oculatus]
MKCFKCFIINLLVCIALTKDNTQPSCSEQRAMGLKRIPSDETQQNCSTIRMQDAIKYQTKRRLSLRKYEKLIAQCSTESDETILQEGYMFNVRYLEQESTNLTFWVSENAAEGHEVYIPRQVFQNSLTKMVKKTRIAITVINETSWFQTSKTNEILENTVIGVTLGSDPISNLTDRVRVTFKHNNERRNGTCVFWKEDDYADDDESHQVCTAENITLEAEGSWSEEGCETSKTSNTFICDCSHLSFFAILMATSLF